MFCEQADIPKRSKYSEAKQLFWSEAKYSEASDLYFNMSLNLDSLSRSFKVSKFEILSCRAWKFHQVSLELLALLIRYDIRPPAQAVQLFVENMTNATINLRKVNSDFIVELTWNNQM